MGCKASWEARAFSCSQFRARDGHLGPGVPSWPLEAPLWPWWLGLRGGPALCLAAQTPVSLRLPRQGHKAPVFWARSHSAVPSGPALFPAASVTGCKLGQPMVYALP